MLYSESLRPSVRKGLVTITTGEPQHNPCTDCGAVQQIFKAKWQARSHKGKGKVFKAMLQVLGLITFIAGEPQWCCQTSLEAKWELTHHHH